MKMIDVDFLLVKSSSIHRNIAVELYTSDRYDRIFISVCNGNMISYDKHNGLCVEPVSSITGSVSIKTCRVPELLYARLVEAVNVLNSVDHIKCFNAMHCDFDASDECSSFVSFVLNATLGITLGLTRYEYIDNTYAINDKDFLLTKVIERTSDKQHRNVIDNIKEFKNTKQYNENVDNDDSIHMPNTPSTLEQRKLYMINRQHAFLRK